MSWTQRSQEIVHRDFTEQAAVEPVASGTLRWNLDVWEITSDGQEREYSQSSARRVHSKAKLRVVMAPLDLAQRETKGLMVELFHKFGIPNDFTSERARSVSYSFAQRSNDNGFSSWFRLSGKSFDHGRAHGKQDMGFGDQQSSFFLQAVNDGSATLICFGAGLQVERSIREFIKSKAWIDVGTNQYILFDTVLEGLCNEADDAVWGLNLTFQPTEDSIMNLANSQPVSARTVIPLLELYNYRRCTIELVETLESCILVVDGILSSIGDEASASAGPMPSPSGIETQQRQLVNRQLRECLQYRQTLFRSTQLRLFNLQARIDNAIALSSKLIAQQQSTVLVHGPISMKLIAAILLIFMPTITITTILGSQLLISEQQEDQSSWSVKTTPLFYIVWWVSIPLTIVVITVALSWLWWSQLESQTGYIWSMMHRAAKWRRRKRSGNEKSMA